ncbi:MAG TPA: NnrU family protein [Rubrivivax sp.]|nr:NnrU family protein [Rubrivivax sp.]HPO18284.1 NnrU family protein [Rubrivivax sp.]
MSQLILGLVVFLGVHSVRIVADGWRSAQIARRGMNAWKGVYSLVSLAGFALIVWGYGLARLQPQPLWAPPRWAPHLSSLLMLFAFILLVAAYVPRNGIKRWVHHPMLLGVMLWAIAHLLANGTLADLLLFGSFGVWAVLDFIAARQRDHAAGDPQLPGTLVGTLIALGVGVAAWALFAFWAHAWLFGVSPMG